MSYLTDDAIIVDYSNLAPQYYIQDGFLFGQSPRREGLPYFDEQNGVRIATHGSATSDSFWNGLESVTLGNVHDQSGLTISQLAAELCAHDLRIKRWESQCAPPRNRPCGCLCRFSPPHRGAHCMAKPFAVSM